MSERSQEFKDRVQAIKDEGYDVWSISKINTAHQCPREYYLTYILEEESKDNIYGYLGTAIHDALEAIQNDELDSDDLWTVMHEALLEAEDDNLYFPSEMIGDNWVEDVMDFCNKFNKIDIDMDTELGVIFKIEDEFFQGFIDCLIKDKEGNLHILDWKTSSSFNGKDLIKAGRQLVIYKLAYEQIYKKPIKTVSWYMIKYAVLEYDGRRYELNRRKIYEKASEFIKRELDNLGYGELMSTLILNKFYKTKSIEDLPDEIKDKISIKPCVITYNATDDVLEEMKQYVLNEIKNIKKRGNNIEEWQPCDIKKNEFYCLNLCGQKNNCKAFEDYIRMKK